MRRGASSDKIAQRSSILWVPALRHLPWLEPTACLSTVFCNCNGRKIPKCPNKADLNAEFGPPLTYATARRSRLHLHHSARYSIVSTTACVKCDVSHQLLAAPGAERKLMRALSPSAIALVLSFGGPGLAISALANHPREDD